MRDTVEIYRPEVKKVLPVTYLRQRIIDTLHRMGGNERWTDGELADAIIRDLLEEKS